MSVLSRGWSVAPRFRVFPPGGAVVVGMTILAAVFGVGEVSWVHGVIVVAAGWLLVIEPVVATAGVRLWGAFAVAAVGPLLAFLPEAFPPGWRRELIAGGWLEGGGMNTVQPWMAAGLLPVYYSLLGMAWWLAGQSWHESHRRTVARILGATGAIYVVWRLAGTWGEVADGVGIGTFPSRNQTGVVLAMAGILQAALWQSHFVRRVPGGWVWAVSLGMTVLGLGMNGSRAGVALLALGLILLGVSGLLARPRSGLGAAGFVMIVAVVGIVTVVAWPVVDRIRPGVAPAEASFRLMVQRDALAMTLDSPVAGFGLGSFDAVFPFYRQASASAFRAEHPENDWIWLAADCGWLTVAAVAALVAVVFSIILRSLTQAPTPVRAGGFACGAVFLLHTLVDASAHHSGALLFAMTATALAWPGRNRPVSAWVSRLAGGVLLAMAVGFVIYLLHPRPDHPRVVALLSEAGRDGFPTVGEDDSKILKRALVVAPLHWALVEALGHAYVKGGNMIGATRKFALLEKLEPFDPVPTQAAGEALLASAPSAAGRYFVLSVRRASADERARIFAGNWRRSVDHPVVRGALAEFAREDAELEQIMLESERDPGMEAVKGFLDRHRHAPDLDVGGAARLAVRVLPEGDVRTIAEEDSPLGRAVAVEWLRRLAREGRFEAACRGALALLDSTRRGAGTEAPRSQEVAAIQRARQQLGAGGVDPKTRREILRLSQDDNVSRGVLAIAGRILFAENDPQAAWGYFDRYFGGGP